MLNAILKGKSRRIPEEISEGASLREVFKRSEDILTASVFERLGYLSGQTLWHILGLAFGRNNFPDRRVVELEEIEFWPLWAEARDQEESEVNHAIEPDVLLRLSVGDPTYRVALIVECKLDTSHYSAQLIDEWRAYLAEYDEVEPVDEVWIICIGGSLLEAQRAIVRLKEVAMEKGGQIHAAGATWQQMLAAIEAAAPASSCEQRVLVDALAALRLHGFWQFRPMSELREFSQRWPVNAETSKILRWRGHA